MSDIMNNDTITLTAQCLCRAHTFTATLPKSSLPIKASACNCHSCRHTVGGLYSMDVPWPQAASDVDLSALKVFQFSQNLTVHFCGTCSTPFFFEHPKAKPPHFELGVFSGTLKNIAVEGDVQLIKITNNIYVSDTLDGGAAPWLRTSGTKCFKARSVSATDINAPGEEYQFPPESSLTGYEKKRDDAVPIRCKCRGIDFVLHRYDAQGKKADELPWYVDPTTHKYTADHCVCDSCRLFSGIEIYNWTFAPLDRITFKDGKSVSHTQGLRKLVDDNDASFGTLKYYASSPDVQRYFCSACSACVFYAVDDRPDMVDVAVGILDASDGARAEGMLAWQFEKVDFPGDVKGGWREGLVDGVMEAAREWREQRGYPKI